MPKPLAAKAGAVHIRPVMRSCQRRSRPMKIHVQWCASGRSRRVGSAKARLSRHRKRLGDLVIALDTRSNKLRMLPYLI